MTRNPYLDGLRGVAIAFVLLWHYVGCQIIPAQSELSWLRQLVNLGWSGVDLFFVLSGFLITGILRDAAGSQNYWSAFYWRRACRILPLYIILLGSYLLLLCADVAGRSAWDWLLSTPMPIWSYATFTQNIAMGLAGGTGANWMGITWSLAVEEQFYLLLPLLVHLLPKRALAWSFFAGIIMAVVLRAFFPGYGALVNMPCKADALCLGGLLALLYREPKLFDAFRHRLRWIRFATILFFAGAVAMNFHLWPLTGAELQLSRLSAATLLWLALFYSLVLLLVLLEPNNSWFRPLCHPSLRWLGSVSYAVYLFHQLISGLLHMLILQEAPYLASPAAAMVTFLALSVTLLLAEISRRWFDGPLINWGRRMNY